MAKTKKPFYSKQQKPNKSIKNGQKIWINISPKKIQMSNRFVKQTKMFQGQIIQKMLRYLYVGK